LRATQAEFKIEERPASPVQNNSSESRDDQTVKLGLYVQPLTRGDRATTGDQCWDSGSGGSGNRSRRSAADVELSAVTWLNR